jgi:hypothetical protein
MTITVECNNGKDEVLGLVQRIQDLIAGNSDRIRPGDPPERQRAAASSALYYMPFLDVAGLLAGYGEYNRVIGEVARATEVVLIEGEDSIPGDDEHFADTVHFRDPGLRLQADRVLSGILASEPYQTLLERRKSPVGR